jgi:hypothetical protein
MKDSAAQLGAIADIACAFFAFELGLPRRRNADV